MAFDRYLTLTKKDKAYLKAAWYDFYINKLNYSLSDICANCSKTKPDHYTILGYNNLCYLDGTFESFTERI